MAVAKGYSHSMVLHADGTVQIWGTWQSTDEGGDSLPAFVPPEVTNVVAIAAGMAHSVALKADGTVAAWGAFHPELTNLPPGLTSIVAIAANSGHSLALKRDGTVLAWGMAYNGNIDVPTNLSQVVAIAAGDDTSIALKSDGTVQVWGWSMFGQTSVPLGLTNVTAISSWLTHCLALAGGPRPGSSPMSQFVLSNHTFSATLPTCRTTRYQMEFKNSLADPDWTLLPPVVGDGAMKTLNDACADAPQRYYRVFHAH